MPPSSHHPQIIIIVISTPESASLALELMHAWSTADAGSLRIFQILSTSQLSVAAWVHTASSQSAGVILFKSGMITVSYTTCFLCPYTVRVHSPLPPIHEMGSCC